MILDEVAVEDITEKVYHLNRNLKEVRKLTIWMSGKEHSGWKEQPMQRP